MNAAVIKEVVETAARLIGLIPAASEAIRAVLSDWCAENEIDQEPVLRAVLGDLDEKVAGVDSDIDAKLAGLGLKE